MTMGSVIKMYGVLAGGAEAAIAQMDVPMPGDIIGVQWSLRGNLAGTDHFAEVQLSFRSTASFTTNDDRGLISEVRMQHDLTTSGSFEGMVNIYSSIPELAVMGGERLYLHANATASFAGAAIALVHFSFDLDKISTRRR